MIAQIASARNSPKLEAALELARLDFLVFQAGLHKRPIEHGWQARATSDLRTVRSLWLVRPWCNIAALTGERAGFFVVDVDVHHDGDVALDALIAAHGTRWLDTVSVRTPSGGAHFYFMYPTGQVIKNVVGGVGIVGKRLGPGVDIRGNGGLVILPPSDIDGRRYEWQRSPMNTAMRQPPAWLLELLRPPPQRPPSLPPGPLNFIRPWPERYVAVAVASIIADMAKATEGNRNAVLNSCAFAAGRLVSGGAVARDAIAKPVLEAARAVGLEQGEIQRSFQSGFAAGLRNPARPPIMRRGR